MRLQVNNGTNDTAKLKEFSDWLIKVGEGKLGILSDGISEIQIPKDLLVKEVYSPIEAIASSTYP